MAGARARKVEPPLTALHLYSETMHASSMVFSASPSLPRRLGQPVPLKC
jgi:hypothetical protein